MFIYAVNNGFDKNNMSPVMTWYKNEVVPQNAELNFTYNLNENDVVNIGNGEKEFFVNSRLTDLTHIYIIGSVRSVGIRRKRRVNTLCITNTKRLKSRKI